MADDELVEVVCKYPRFVRDCLNFRPRPPMTDFIPRPWQKDLIDMLSLPVHPRKIYWYWEASGNVGKSYLASYLALNMNALVVTSGKTSDIAHAYDGQSIVVWDLSRFQLEHVNFGPMEDMKNGRIFSPKYDSTVKYFDIPHVVIFANWPCPPGRFSADRLEEVHLDFTRLTITPIGNHVNEVTYTNNQNNTQ